MRSTWLAVVSVGLLLLTSPCDPRHATKTLSFQSFQILFDLFSENSQLSVTPQERVVLLGLSLVTKRLPRTNVPHHRPNPTAR